MNSLQLIVALVQELGFSPEKAIKLINTAPHQYRHYQIPKRTGGVRDIHHPTPSLKAVQRWLCSRIFNSFPVHDAVHSYRSGRGIKSHAESHVFSNYLLRIDFKDFFPSIDRSSVADFLRQSVRKGYCDLGEDAVGLVARLVCRFSERDGAIALSIGAPSSPMLSNAMLFDLDSAIEEVSSCLGCVYTRYADDIYISSCEPLVLAGVEKKVRDLVGDFSPRLTINESKNLHLSRKRKRVVTGLVITPDRSVSMGRDRKRAIRTKVYLYATGRASAEGVEGLAGLLAFANDVEPEFVESLRRKYGVSTINSLLYRAGSSSRTGLGTVEI